MEKRGIVNLSKAESAAKELLLSLGFDLSDPNYTDTPRRMVAFLAEYTSALRKESADELEKCFCVVFPNHIRRKTSYKGMIIQSPIRVYSLCSHHLLPVIYDIAFAYIPRKNKQIGFSKVVRILRHVAKQPMNQEDFTQEVVELFFSKMKPRGLAIIVAGVHLCMKIRGVRSQVVNKTSAVKGDFKDYERTRDEFLTLATNFNHPL